jgi:hypothetical protein
LCVGGAFRCAIRDSFDLKKTSIISEPDACELARWPSCAEIYSGGSKVLDPDAILTQEEILLRFKKVFNRDMTLAEKRSFVLLESFANPDTDNESMAAKRH